MAIETLEDYIAQASCCCPQILCPIPEEVCESITGIFGGQSVAYVSGIQYWSVEYQIYWVDIYGTHHDDDRYQRDSRGWNLLYGPCGETDYEDQSSWQPDPDLIAYATSGGNVDGTEANPFSETVFTANILAKFDTFTFDALGCPAGSLCSSSKSGVWDEAASLDNPTLTKVRTRWRIPHEWTDPISGLTVPFPGTYFLITYDILEEPDDGDPSFYLEDQTALWTGPGSGDADDPSWFTDWITIPPPSVPGTRRIVNRRLVCRENWGLGVLPQVWGEAVTLPDP